MKLENYEVHLPSYSIGNMGGTAEADSFCPRDSSRDAGLGMKAFFIALSSLHPFRKDDISC